MPGSVQSSRLMTTLIRDSLGRVTDRYIDQAATPTLLAQIKMDLVNMFEGWVNQELLDVSFHNHLSDSIFVQATGGGNFSISFSPSLQGALMGVVTGEDVLSFRPENPGPDFRLTPYNQASGDASNTDLLINRTQTPVGSGAQLLIDVQVGGVSKFKVDNVEEQKLVRDAFPSSDGLESPLRALSLPERVGDQDD